MTWPIRHLTAEDLDAFHSASLSAEANQHLTECADCRSLVERDRALLEKLETLSSFSPRADLADRVIAQIAQPVPVATRAPSRRPLALAASLAVLLGGSVVWSLFNRPLLGSVLTRVGGAIREFLWEGLATIAQNLSDQPWLASVQQFAGSGARLVLMVGVLLAGYAAAMIAFRRLLRYPVSAGSPNW
jgi:hypothetical protein